VKGMSVGFVVTHYRECTDDEKIERSVPHPLVAYFLDQQVSNIQATASMPSVNAFDLDHLSMDMPVSYPST
jgi:hypothetical protein